jgi:hypothetical protein
MPKCDATHCKAARIDEVLLELDQWEVECELS